MYTETVYYRQGRGLHACALAQHAAGRGLQGSRAPTIATPHVRPRVPMLAPARGVPTEEVTSLREVS